MKEILGLGAEELKSDLLAAGYKSFVARQVCQWVYQKGCIDPQEWSDISLAARSWLESHYRATSVQLLRSELDEDGTQKLLIGLQDGRCIEAVHIPEKNHATLCLSTQVGCSLGCLFCATGRMGLSRNLTVEEILAQILLLKRGLPLGPQKINLVFMGMGEPLQNYSNLAGALALITSAEGFGISPRHITVSTAGIVPVLAKLEREFPLVKIAISLNAPDQELRTELMPVSAGQPLATLMAHLRGRRRRHRVTFEYVLIRGKNDAPAQARKLAALVHGIPAKFNLIPYNENPGCGFLAPSEEGIMAFQKILADKGFTVVVRWSKGQGIRSACGQLATSSAPDP